MSNQAACSISYLHACSAAAISTGCVFFAFYPNLDNIGGSADPWIDFKRTRRAVVDTGAAFHAGVKVDDSRLAFPHFQYMLRTDTGAKATANAQIRMQLQGAYIFDIPEGSHLIFFLFLRIAKVFRYIFLKSSIYPHTRR
jgi:hypothetical protein